jgi:serine/threonine-protein kinase
LTGALTGAAPLSIGDYDLLDVLGRGGMGVIYRARHRASGRVVALKVMLSGDLATAEERQRFHAEINAARILDHPHIVSIEDVGEHAGRLFYTMTVYPAALADDMDRFRAPAAAAALVATVARAVHHGHVRGVLHRDLKPANILLDDNGRPHVSDFGTAKFLGEARLTATGMVVGTPMYMAPEQAAGGDHGVTTAADIYSLGTILYELLTGAPPFDGSDASILHALRDGNRVAISPRALMRTIPRDLATICLTCLEKAPAARYRSAEELADDLQRFLRREPIIARPTSWRQRLWRFTRHHRFVVGAGIGTTMLLAVVAATAIGVASTQEQELKTDALSSNTYIAQTLAQYVYNQLTDQINPRGLGLARIASDPDVVARVDHRDSLAPACPPAGDKNAPLHMDLADLAFVSRFLGETYDSIALFDHCGMLIAFKSAGEAHMKDMKANYRHRDYFQGARSLGERRSRRGYISSAFQCDYDGSDKFGISMPIYQNDRWIGVVLATLSTNSMWKNAPLPARNDHDHSYLIAAPQTSSRADRAPSAPYVVVLHAAPGGEGHFTLDSPAISEFSRRPVVMTDDDFHDPLPGFQGRWLAGLAPVGDTRFAMIAMTRHDAAVRPSAQLSHRLLQRVSMAIVLWSLLFGFPLWGYAYRLRRR